MHPSHSSPAPALLCSVFFQGIFCLFGALGLFWGFLGVDFFFLLFFRNTDTQTVGEMELGSRRHAELLGGVCVEKKLPTPGSRSAPVERWGGGRGFFPAAYTNATKRSFFSKSQNIFIIGNSENKKWRVAPHSTTSPRGSFLGFFGGGVAAEGAGSAAQGCAEKARKSAEPPPQPSLPAAGASAAPSSPLALLLWVLLFFFF